MAKLNYLTVQDVLWMNLQLTRQKHEFDYARIEEATYYQYGYGKSLDLAGQAAQVLLGFRKMRPFPRGNEACALVSTLAFLQMNGNDLRLDDAEALDWCRDLWSNPDRAPESIRDRLIDAGEGEQHHEVPPKAEIMDEIFARYRNTLRTLVEEEAGVPLA